MTNDIFLNAFRALDTELKSEGKTVVDYENSLDTVNQEKLKVCRIMRNYMAHNDTTFLATTSEQFKFLEDQTYKIRSLSHTVKDEMKKIKTVKSSITFKELSILLDKFPYVPVETKIGLYIVDKDIFIHQLAKGNKKLDIPTKLPKYNYLSKLTKMDSISNGFYIITEDGLSTSKYLGLLIKE